MFKLYFYTTLAVINTLASFPTNASAATFQTALGKIQSYKEAVITIRAQTVSFDGHRASALERTGAGVVIDPKGIIVTNTHIIYGSNIIKVILQDGTRLNAQILFISKEYDFSLLKIDPPHPLTAIAWADSDKISLGEEVITIGHSPLLNQTISGGRINGLGTRTLEDGTITPELLQISINHYPGDSGGPVFDNSGRLIGLMNAKRTTVQRAAFAVPSNKIHLEYFNLVNPAEKQ